MSKISDDSSDLVCSETAAEAEKSSPGQDLDELQLFEKFTKLFCTSTETKHSEAITVVNLIRSENGSVGLKNISRGSFS